MIQEEILEGNKLIAEFMGAIVITDYPDHVLFDMTKDRTQNERYWASTTLKYHSEWNWIMPVIEKIKYIYDNQDDFLKNYHKIDLQLSFFYGVELHIDSNRIFLQTAFGENTFIDAIYKATVEFIKWYNSQTNKNEFISQ